ncbi:MAG: DUF1934 domain-containing protein [Lachnospiraceae bacterium]|nr:DUF1934 domain-containing protein [Lachnospiraceae bacterium]
MNKDVIISINGLQVAEDTDDAVEVVTVGEYYNRNNKHYIVYEEIDSDNGAKTKNIIKVSEEIVEIKKVGNVNTNMSFASQKTNRSYYSTPFGDFTIDINTNDIAVNVGEKDMDIKIDYALSINNQHTNDCRISMSVKEMM